MYGFLTCVNLLDIDTSDTWPIVYVIKLGLSYFINDVILFVILLFMNIELYAYT